MGIGFWITQAILVVAAIAIAISAERNRAESDTPGGSDDSVRRIPVEPATVRRGASQFTASEQSRLARLQRLVQQARALKTALYDDLHPDGPSESAPALLAPGAVRRWRMLAVGTGALLVCVGILGASDANADLSRIERASRGTIPTATLANHLMPGVIANPGKYLDAVNSASSPLVSQRDPLQVVAWLDHKQTLDRFEALVGLGIACLLAATAGWPRASLDDEPTAGVSSDILPFVLLAAFFLLAISFFELP